MLIGELIYCIVNERKKKLFIYFKNFFEFIKIF